MVAKECESEVHIFSNGEEYRYWVSKNCSHCKFSCNNNGQPKDEPPICRIEYALMVGPGIGLITAEIKDAAIGNVGMCRYKRSKLDSGEPILHVTASEAKTFWTDEGENNERD